MSHQPTPPVPPLPPLLPLQPSRAHHHGASRSAQWASLGGDQFGAASSSNALLEHAALRQMRMEHQRQQSQHLQLAQRQRAHTDVEGIAEPEPHALCPAAPTVSASSAPTDVATREACQHCSACAASATSSAAVEPSAPAAATPPPPKAGDPIVAYARSLTRLRSSLLSTYALYRWLAEQLQGSDHASQLTNAVTNAADAEVFMRSGGAIARRGLSSAGSSSALHSLTHRLGSASRSESFQMLRRFLRTAFHLWTLHSRRFHRFLRPHLLLLMRSRALSNLLGVLMPALRRNALLVGHSIFVWGSAWIVVQRLQGDLATAITTPSKFGGVFAPASILATFRAAIRARIVAFRQLLLGGWRNMRFSSKLLWCTGSLGSLFILWTCYTIVREHAERRARRLQELLRELPAAEDADPALAIWTQERVQAELDRSPEPTPEPTPVASPSHTPTLTPSASAHDLAGAASSASALTHHMPSYSWHRDCSACVATAITSSTAAAFYAHNHPPHGFGFLDGTDEAAAHAAHHLMLQEQYTSPQHHTPHAAAALAMHPVANAISKRMEWSPSRLHPGLAAAASAHASAAPGTPPLMPPSSALTMSFVSPASQRLTNIRLQARGRHGQWSTLPPPSTASLAQSTSSSFAAPSSATSALTAASTSAQPPPALIVSRETVTTPLVSSSSPQLQSQSEPSTPAAAGGFLPSLRSLFRS